MKTYIGIIKDHSASISQYGLNAPAMNDYNLQIEGIKRNSLQGEDNIVSVIKCGASRSNNVNPVAREVVISSAAALKPLTEYIADGYSTPLYDSVGELITLFQSLPDAADKETCFLIMAITDGEENSSDIWRYTLGKKIKELQATDRWSFVFRVPKGYGRNLIKDLQIYEGNVCEWNVSKKGLEKASELASSALDNFFKDRRKGKTATKSFFANLADVDIAQVKSELEDITTEVAIFNVEEDGSVIRPFVEEKIGNKMLKGAAFYELLKSEEVQDYKVIIIRDKNTNKYYSGDSARTLLALPFMGNVRLRPGDHGQYDIYIQSTSINRKLPKGSSLVYWSNIGKMK